MRLTSKLAIAFLVIGLASMVAFKFVAPMFEANNQRETSDARATKGKLVIGVDNWIGYFPLCSSEMRMRMRRSGYNLQCEDDNADYPGRMKKLDGGEYQFAVATVDSYLLNGEKEHYPGTIVAVLDESKGGDAVVAWSDKVQNLDAMKSSQDLLLAFTPSSPSEHLLKSMAVHFDIPVLKERKGAWRVHAEGSEDALRRLLRKEVDVAVLWEPDVTRAITTKGVIKLLGTEDTNKLIVDILLVNRGFSRKNPEAVNVLLRNYFLTLKHYKGDPDALLAEAAGATGLTTKQVKVLLEGVAWANLTDNAIQWYGVSSMAAGGSEGLIDAIEGAMQILLDSGDFPDNPIPDEDPYRLTNSGFVAELYGKGGTATQFGHTIQSSVVTAPGPLEKKFAALSDSEWNGLREIGTLKIRPIVFQSGTSQLTFDGKRQVDKAVENLRHYPNFRILVKGHTGLRGEKLANQKLSDERARAVARYMQVTYGVDSNRIRPVGMGMQEPLPRKSGETGRAYSYRLPRVELLLVAEDI